jgi:benzodiazapine receptor
MKKIIPAVISVLIAHAAGTIGAFFCGMNSKVWYKTLVKPVLTPPSWVFGPVWGILYTLMGLAAYLVWDSRATNLRSIALGAYGFQLVLNALWTYFFFYCHSPAWALVDICVLWVAIIATTALFWKVRMYAGALFVPYLVWVSFAVYLNYMIWCLNS